MAICSALKANWGSPPVFQTRRQGNENRRYTSVVVIADGMRSLLGDLCELRDLEWEHLKAIADLRAPGWRSTVFGGKPLRGVAYNLPDNPDRAVRRNRIAGSPARIAA
jgi:hypothetical protein